MAASITHLRPRRPNRRQNALPLAPALRNSTPERDARWLAAYQEDCARRGFTTEQATFLTAWAAESLSGPPGVMSVPDPGRWTAIYDALNCASLSVLQAEGGDGRKAEEAYMEASVAAMGAFPEGSAEAAALNVILGAVGDMSRGVTA